MFTKDGGTIYLGLFKDSNEMFWYVSGSDITESSLFYRMVI